jgi:hypothetical protein
VPLGACCGRRGHPARGLARRPAAPVVRNEFEMVPQRVGHIQDRCDRRVSTFVCEQSADDLWLRLHAAGELGLAEAARTLWTIRWKIGKLLDWDRPDAGLGSRVPTLRDKLPADLREAPSGPDFAALPFSSLYLLADEWADDGEGGAEPAASAAAGCALEEDSGPLRRELSARRAWLRLHE